MCLFKATAVYIAIKVWILEPYGDGDSICLRSHLHKYLAVDQFGNVTCENEEKNETSKFEISVCDDFSGRWVRGLHCTVRCSSSFVLEYLLLLSKFLFDCLCRRSGLCPVATSWAARRTVWCAPPSRRGTRSCGSFIWQPGRRCVLHCTVPCPVLYLPR